MIGMKIFITALLALDFISPIDTIKDDDEPKIRKTAAVIVLALYAVGIVFTWII